MKPLFTNSIERVSLFVCYCDNVIVRKVKTINKPRFLFIIGNNKKKKHKKRTHTETEKNKTKQNKTSRKHQQQNKATKKQTN